MEYPMPSTVLTEKQQELDKAREEAKAFYAENPPEKVKDDRDLLDQSLTHNRKMAALHDEVSRLQEDEAGRERATKQRESVGRVTEDGDPSIGGPKAIKTIADMLEESDAYKAVKGARLSESKKRTSVELGTFDREAMFSNKALLTLANIDAAPQRRPGIVGSVQDETTVADLMLQGTTDANTLTYWEETTFTNAAATVAEGDPKPESALDFTERTDNVRKIATWIPATDELLEDVAGFRSYLEGRLRFMVQRVEEDQLLNGDGTAPNISGILDRSGVQTIGSAGSDADAVYRGITEVRVDGGAEPTAIVMHPLSWQNIRLSKDQNDQYYGPGPFSADATERLWGLPVRVTPLIAEGTALVGAFRPFAQVFRRGGITVTASTEHSTYFVENKIAVLAEERLALAVYRPAAFCTVTGLASS